MPAFTCSETRAEVKKPSANTTRMKLGTLRSERKMPGITWYQRKTWTRSGMLRKSSVQASAKNASPLCGTVRRMPTSEPTTRATTRASTATESVHPHADIIHSR